MQSAARDFLLVAAALARSAGALAAQGDGPIVLGRLSNQGEVSFTRVYDWNVPMPADENPDSLHWKPGVPTLGVNRINAGGAGVDQCCTAPRPCSRCRAAPMTYSALAGNRNTGA